LIHQENNMSHPALRPLALAVALLAAAASASAADVRIYGRMDSGLLYQHNFGDSAAADDSFTMNSGLNTASRWGIRGSEKLSADTTVWFQLENRYLSDDGSFKTFTKGKDGRMFGGHALLGVTSSWGEFAAGRTSGITSGSGRYDVLWMTDAFGGGTVGRGNAPVKAGRYDNMLVYRTPMFSGFQATFQYSLKTESYDEGDESTSDVDRYYGAGLAYKGQKLKAALVYEGAFWGHKTQIAAGADQSWKMVTLGAGYRFEPVTVYGMAQYFSGLNQIDGFTASRELSQIEGYALSLGAEFWFGPSSWKNMVYYKDYKNKYSDSEDFDGQTFGIGSKFVYRPSKRVEFYIGAGFTQYDRVSSGDVLTDKEVNAYGGTTIYF
jgi:predicted porin